jgi:hypothetical protein
MKGLFTAVATALVIIGSISGVMVLSGKKLPFVPAGLKSGFITVAVIGIMACSFAITRDVKAMNWGNIFNIAAAVLGTIALITAVLVLEGKKIIFTDGYKAGIIILMFIMIIKSILVIVHNSIKVYFIDLHTP